MSGELDQCGDARWSSDAVTKCDEASKATEVKGGPLGIISMVSRLFAPLPAANGIPCEGEKVA
jgi:hypothetical protein